MIDGGASLLAVSHTERGDTLSVCGRIDTGLSLLLNWNLLPTDCFGYRYHRVMALADGILFASTEFQAANFVCIPTEGDRGFRRMMTAESDDVDR